MGEGMWVALALQTVIFHLIKVQKLVISMYIQNIRPFFTPRLISKKIDNGYIIVINIKYTEVIQS
jgi:hypothetical protein